MRLPRVRVEPGLVAAVQAPLPLALVREALERQPELRLPAKLALSRDGSGQLLAEIVRDGDPGRACERVRNVLAAADAWLRGCDPQPPGEVAHPDRRDVEAALARLLWPVRDSPLGWWVDVTESALECRVEVEIGAGAIAVSTTELVLEPEGARALEALVGFALRANAALRLARISIARQGPRIVVQWDAVLPGFVAPDPALAEVVEALVGARRDTLRSLRALCSSAVAERYLGLRRSARSAHCGAGLR